MPDTKDCYVVGVDLGGTKILAGLFDSSLECVGTAKVSTKAQRGLETVLSRVERCVRDAVDEADLNIKQVRGVGIGAPGAVDFASGTVLFAPNLEGWKDGKTALENNIADLTDSLQEIKEPLREVFGDHVKITATPSNIEVKAFSHD